MTAPDHSVGGSTAQAASSGAAMLVGRYAFVGLMNVGATTFLVRRLGPAAWASYGVALFLANFVDQYLGSKLLGTVIAARQPSRGLLRAGAFSMQVIGTTAVTLGVLLAVPVDKVTDLRAPILTCLAAGICGYVCAVRALPAALMERALQYRWIALGEVLDQVTFTVFAITSVITGVGLAGVMAALAFQGVPTLAIWRWRARPTPFFGERNADLRAIWKFAVPGSAMALCALAEGLVPITLLGVANARLLGLSITSVSMLSYPAVAVLILQRIAFPAFTRAAHDQGRLAEIIDGISRASVAILIGSVGFLGLASPLWMPWLFGSRWHGAWPLASSFAATFVLMGPINVMIGGLMALERPRDAFAVWKAMLGIWVVGAAAWVFAGAPVWLATALVAARFVGFLVGSAKLRAAGLAINPMPVLVQGCVASVMIIGGAAATAHGDVVLGVSAVVALLALEAVAISSSWPWLTRLVRSAVPRSRSRQPVG